MEYSECDEVADGMDLSPEALAIKSYDDAIRHVCAEMPDESSTVIGNVAEAFYNRVRAARNSLIAQYRGL